MALTRIHATFAPIRRLLPAWAASPIRRLGTAVLTPLIFSYRTGHLRSSLLAKAVKRDGTPLPWYTYPSIDFLKNRDFADKSVLEFGAGQSTLWWADRAKHVVSLEGDKGWYEHIARTMPGNVALHLVSTESPEACVENVRRVLAQHSGPFDVIVIDGLYRFEMADIARELLADDGAIICDNAEGYGIEEAFRHSGMNRVDFYGHTPGVVLPHSTSIFFGPSSFLFSAGHPIVDIATSG